MARDTDSIFLSSDIWALTGDRSAPAFPINTGWGIQYEQDPDVSGVQIERENVNNEFYRLSLLANLTTTYGGCLEWDSSIPYAQGAIVVGSNGSPYFAKQANSNQDPALDVIGTYWGDLSASGGSDIALNTQFRETQGNVKVNNGNGVRPTISMTTTAAGTPTTEQQFTYSSPLGISSPPTSHYPISETDKNETSMYDFVNDTFLEFRSLGCANTFRFTFRWTKPGALNSKFIINIRLYNQLSSFTLGSSNYISEETSSGVFSCLFLTIADNVSLPAPLGTGKGYKLAISIVGDNGSQCDVTLDNFVRFNTPNSYIAP